MAWLAIKDGEELIYDYDETRKDGIHYSFIKLPAGSIEKLTGKKELKEPIRIE